MANDPTIKLDIESQEPEYKGDAHRTSIAAKDKAGYSRPLSDSVASMGVATNHKGTASENHDITIMVGGSSESERLRNAEHITKMLKEAGMTPKSAETIGSQTSIKIDNMKGDNALMEVTHTLGQNWNGPKGESISAKLTSNVIGAIEEHHLATTGKTPSEAGLITIKENTPDARWHADRGITEQKVATIEAHVPHGPVAAIREDTMLATAEGMHVSQTTSSIELRDSQAKAVEAMKAAGLKATLHTGEKDYLVVEGTANQVAHALAEKNLLPAHVAKDISDRALAAHPHAEAVNQAIAHQETQMAQQAAAPKTDTPAAPVPEAHATEAHVPEGHVPEMHAPHARVKGGGGLKALLIGSLGTAAILAANGASAAEIGEGAKHGAEDAVLPGVSDGFKAARGDNSSLDTWFARADTATQGVATGAGVVAAGAGVVAGAGVLTAWTGAGAVVAVGAGLTAAGSLAVAGVAEVANLGLSLVHDVTYVTGLSKEGGIVTGLVDVGDQLVHSKAAYAAEAHIKTAAAEAIHKATALAHDAGAAITHIGAEAPHAVVAVAHAAEAHIQQAAHAAANVAHAMGSQIDHAKSVVAATVVGHAVVATVHAAEAQIDHATAAVANSAVGHVVASAAHAVEAGVESYWDKAKAEAMAAVKGVSGVVTAAVGSTGVNHANVPQAAGHNTQVASR